MAAAYGAVGAHFAPRRPARAPWLAALAAAAALAALALLALPPPWAPGMAPAPAPAPATATALAAASAAAAAAGACAAARGRDPAAVAARGAAVEFFAVGDWGLDTEEGHADGPRADWDVAEQVALGKALNARVEDGEGAFVLNVGDNFYQYGINDVEDDRWETTLEDVFGTTRVVPWYSMLGNHDYYGNLLDTSGAKPRSAGIDAQIDRTFHPRNKRWCMPATNYTIKYETADVDVRIVVFNSQALVRVGPDALSGAYDSPAVPQIEDHLAWLETAVCAKGRPGRRTIVMTAAHHFFVSVGLYFDVASRDEAILQTRVLPMLKRCGVGWHFHGHDHVTQIIRIDKDLVQVGVGSAGKTNGKILATQKDLARKYPEHAMELLFGDTRAAFARVEVSKHRVAVRLIGADGSDLGAEVTGPGPEKA